MIQCADRRGITDDDQRHLPPSELFQRLDIVVEHLLSIPISWDAAELKLCLELELAHSGKARGVTKCELSGVKPAAGDFQLGFALAHPSGLQHLIRNDKWHTI